MLDCGNAQIAAGASESCRQKFIAKFPGALPFRLLKIPMRSAGIHHITANRFNDVK
jgi:hypothetical protein